MNSDVIDAEHTALAVRAETHPIAPVGILDASDPKEFVSRAKEICAIIVDIIESQGLAKNLGRGKKKHVEVEGWQTLASMPWIRCNAVIEWTREFGDREGWEARAVVYRDGVIVGSGEGLCTYKESNWRGKDYFSLKSMAQTRALSRALQGPLRWIMVMAGYAGAGQEEMPAEGQELAPVASDTPNPANRAPAARNETKTTAPDPEHEAKKAALWERIKTYDVDPRLDHNQRARVYFTAINKANRNAIKSVDQMQRVLDEYERAFAEADEIANYAQDTLFKDKGAIDTP